MLKDLKNFPFSLNGIETNITKRWEKGTPHHPEAIKVAKAIADLDWSFGSDWFCFKFGGDGDNGEHLLYLLDIYFEAKDKENGH